MAAKRSHIEIDPDYEDVSEEQIKRRRFMEEGAKEATKHKIQSIIKKQFEIETQAKEAELVNISEKLELSRKVMDRLRACIVASYYGNASQQKGGARNKLTDQAPTIHPTVRKYIGKAPPGTPHMAGSTEVKQEAPEGKPVKNKNKELGSERIGKLEPQIKQELAMETVTSYNDTDQSETRSGRFKIKKRVIVGNLSKSIPADQRDENDQATHKWMVYVRGPKDSPKIDDFVKKIWFFLHPSYRPNDLVEVSQPPFHLTRRGWGEFPVRVQLHFRDSRNKRLDIVHNLKLDRTYTGLQTLGLETVVDVEIERDPVEIKREKREKHSTPSKSKNRSGKTQESIIGNSTIDGRPETRLEKTKETVSNVLESCDLIQVKSEPIDNDYGVATSVNSKESVKTNPENVTGQLVIKKEPGCSMPDLRNFGVFSNVAEGLSKVESVVSASIITTQAKPQMSPSSSQLSPVMFRVEPITPTKQNNIRVNPVTPKSTDKDKNKNMGVLTSSRNLVFKGLDSISLSNIQGGGMQNQKMTTLVTPTSTLTQPLLQTKVTGNQLFQTGLQNSSPHSTPQGKNEVNKSPASGLVFLKCTDNQGKTYLIPQQICTSPSPIAKGGNSMNLVRVTSPNTQPIFLTSTPAHTQTHIRIPVSPTSSQTTHQPRTLLSTNKFLKNLASVNLNANSNKCAMQKDPVLFIKPGSNTNKTTGAMHLKSVPSAIYNTQSLKVASVASLQSIQTASQAQNLVTKTVNMENQSFNKGQLKVTSQGLIQIEGQAPKSLVLNSLNQTSVKLNGGIAITSPPSRQKQPIILVPNASNNNKLTAISGKAKSLLSPVLQSVALSQSNGNVFVLSQNQTTSLLGNNKAMCRTTTLANQNSVINMQTGKLTSLKGNSQNDVCVLQTKAQRSLVNTSNHLVIIPVTSEQNVTMTTNSNSVIGKTSVVMTSTSARLSNSNLEIINKENKTIDKPKMFIVVQNDKTKGVTLNSSNVTLEGQGQKAGSSLLNSVSLMTTKTPVARQLVTTQVSSVNNEANHVVVVNKVDGCLATKEISKSIHKNKKIMVDLKKKKTKVPEIKEIILPIRVCDYPDMVSLVRATVLRHPVVSCTAGQHVHPYCSKSNQDWLTWNLGKRRASEWQRSSSVRKFITQSLGGETTYKGESLWTTKQILVWCRLHAYSPHYLEKPLHPTAIDVQAETSLSSTKHNRKFTSVTASDQLIQEVMSLQQEVTSSVESSDEEIDIVCVEQKKSRVKVEVKDEAPGEDIEYLPLTEGAMFIEDTAKKIGVRLVPTEVEAGYYGTLSHSVLYKAMNSFMEDILRETFSLQVNMGRYPDALGVSDVYAALSHLPITDFLTNKYLGVLETESTPNTNR